MYRRIVPLLLAAASTCLLAACASTSIKSAWFDTGYAGGALKKILVVGSGGSGSIADRRVFEDIFVQKLQAAGAQGVPGYLALPSDAHPGDTVWNAAVAASGADGLLAVRLLRVDTKTQVMTTMMPGPMVVGPYSISPYYGMWGPSFVAVPEVQQYDIATVETNLWDIKTKHVIWAATTDTFNPTSVAQETPGFADLIIKQLAARGLIAGAAK